MNEQVYKDFVEKIANLTLIPTYAEFWALVEEAIAIIEDN